jgi:threonine/homoserine/homoserine lactone efflux protein
MANLAGGMPIAPMANYDCMGSQHAMRLPNRGEVNTKWHRLAAGLGQASSQEGEVPGPADIPVASVLSFAVGYIAILAVPGPNMLAIGGLAALRGLSAALPVSLGIAAGATLLALSIYVAGLAVPAGQWRCGMHLISAVLLLGVAGHIACAPVSETRAVASMSVTVAGFSLGFCTAASNPITAAYFAAEFAGPLSEAPSAAAGAILTIPILAVAVSITVAGLLTQPRIRCAIRDRHRQVRRAASALLGLLALAILAHEFG